MHPRHAHAWSGAAAPLACARVADAGDGGVVAVEAGRGPLALPVPVPPAALAADEGPERGGGVRALAVLARVDARVPEPGGPAAAAAAAAPTAAAWAAP